MIGLIRVVSGLTEAQLQTHAESIRHLLVDDIVTRAIADQPSGIHDDATFARAVPKIIEVGQRLVADGARLLIVSCAADPAVGELRALVDVPVVGAGSDAGSSGNAVSAATFWVMPALIGRPWAASVPLPVPNNNPSANGRQSRLMRENRLSTAAIRRRLPPRRWARGQAVR